VRVQHGKGGKAPGEPSVGGSYSLMIFHHSFLLKPNWLKINFSPTK